LLFVSLTPVAAQNGLKAGDRIHRPDSSPSADDKGTIKEIGTGRNAGCQLVLWDKVARYEPDHPGHWLCTYGVKGLVFQIDGAGNRIRDINGPAAPAQAAAGPMPRNRPAQAPANTPGRGAPPPARAAGPAQNAADEQAAAALCAGQPLVNFSSRGRPPSAALFRDVIRSMRDVAPSRTTLKTVTTIQSVQLGRAYAWRPGMDLQGLGLPKTVYPVRVSFTTCEDASMTWNISVSRDYPYVCYKTDGFGDWECTLSSGRDGGRESRQVKKQAFYDFTGQTR